MTKRLRWLREDLAFWLDRVGFRIWNTWFEAGVRYRALRQWRWRCVLRGHESAFFSPYCDRCGELNL